MRVWTYGLTVRTVLGYDKVLTMKHVVKIVVTVVCIVVVWFTCIPPSILSFVLESDTPQTYEINLLTC